MCGCIFDFCIELSPIDDKKFCLKKSFIFIYKYKIVFYLYLYGICIIYFQINDFRGLLICLNMYFRWNMSN